jgi:predicted nucleic acid-binding protein
MSYDLQIWSVRPAAASDVFDEMVLETAINGQAKALVTFNRRDFGKAPAAFGIELLLPSEALRRLR